VKHSLFAIFISLCCWTVWALERIPPAPSQYINDYAHVVSPAVAAGLNQTLEQFERDTSSQILVAVFPKMESDSSIEDYTVRVAQAWKMGQKGKDNGAVLFVFVQDRKLFLQVGYGLEGALPDALAKQIIENEIKPRLKNGDYDGGLSAGVAAILAATKGEYKGTGGTAAGSGAQQKGSGSVLKSLVIGLFVLLIFASIFRRRRSAFLAGWILGSGGFSNGGGGGGFSGGDGFSGGGGSFGGGGAGGSW